jgi:anti-sigma-K factor RskA
VTERDDIHELAAAYALDALDGDERDAFEAHLTDCETCAADVQTFRATAAALAYAEPGPEPSPALRTRLLDAARQERPTQSVVVLRPRRALRLATLAAAAALAAAIGLGAWAVNLSRSLDTERSASASSAQIAAILASPDAQRLPMGGRGELVRTANGRSVLLVRGLPAAPEGKTYEAWVIKGGTPSRAGLFRGGESDIVLLGRAVPDGGKVAVTLEPAGGSDAPTGDILFGSGPA